MSNRAQRRAAVANQWPSIRSGQQRCENCHFSSDRKANAAIVSRINELAIVARPLPDDETFCLNEPQERSKKVWAWCGRWTERKPA